MRWPGVILRMRLMHLISSGRARPDSISASKGGIRPVKPLVEHDGMNEKGVDARRARFVRNWSQTVAWAGAVSGGASKTPPRRRSLVMFNLVGDLVW
ncbi:hypothetical protein CRG98_039634 [Punica granatum]|uniref:Uncharacterized protein n=1 Tax=Punica granatum TaxID=22663 RepID=A0A2I0I7M2_PUNGR|nr:hypothetical protein CRG98_039634 [Punica granatum]